jgi:predicted nuclease of restriction endonuclease-like (RecB) superfamily
MDKKRIILKDYAELLTSLKDRIRKAQIRAVLSVNREMVLLYWHIGREILERQARENWGAKVIDRLSIDLRREFPEMRGFSSRNLKYMRAFAEAFPDEAIVKQLVSQIPWVRLISNWKVRKESHPFGEKSVIPLQEGISYKKYFYILSKTIV